MLIQPIRDPKLEEAVSRLVDALHPRAIILFGSRARGVGRVDSDYDLLVVSDQPRDYDQVYRPVAGPGHFCHPPPPAAPNCPAPPPHPPANLSPALPPPTTPPP